MAGHKVSVLGFSERRGDSFSRRPESTLGVIEVKPPVMVGEKFGAVILGREHEGITLAHVGSNQEATILLAETGTRGADKESRQEQINLMAERILVFADDPAKSLDLMQESPFAQAEQRPY